MKTLSAERTTSFSIAGRCHRRLRQFGAPGLRTRAVPPPRSRAASAALSTLIIPPVLSNIISNRQQTHQRNRAHPGSGRSWPAPRHIDRRAVAALDHNGMLGSVTASAKPRGTTVWSWCPVGADLCATSSISLPSSNGSTTVSPGPTSTRATSVIREATVITSPVFALVPSSSPVNTIYTDETQRA